MNKLHAHLARMTAGPPVVLSVPHGGGDTWCRYVLADDGHKPFSDIVGREDAANLRAIAHILFLARLRDRLGPDD